MKQIDVAKYDLLADSEILTILEDKFHVVEIKENNLNEDDVDVHLTDSSTYVSEKIATIIESENQTKKFLFCYYSEDLFCAKIATEKELKEWKL